MRKLLMPLAFLASVAVGQAAGSPYVGSEAGTGKFYLYQVETGKWLQPNMSEIDDWTTHAELGEVGIDVELRKPEGKNFEGFQIYVDFSNNGELNGSDEDRFFFDQRDRDLCDWVFVPVEESGVSHAYNIMIKAKPDSDERSKIAKDTYIGANKSGKFGGLSDKPEFTTWQLVSREDRLAWMREEAKKGNGPVDASWLIPWYDRGRNDNRKNLWTDEWTGGSGNDLNGTNGYPVQEKWNNWTGQQTITLTDLPNGRYSFAVQAYHRDGRIEDQGTIDRFLNGTDNLDNVKYFAGISEANVMSILSNPDTENHGLGGLWETRDNISGKIPNDMQAASRIMHLGHYINNFIETTVTDGTLPIGIRKTGKADGDWLITKRFYLRYLGELESDQVMRELEELIDDCENLKSSVFAPLYTYPSLGIKVLDDALAKAKALIGSQNPSDIEVGNALSALKTVYSLINNDGVKGNILNFNETFKLVSNEAERDWAASHNLPLRAPMALEGLVNQYNNSASESAFADALRDLRYARRMRAAVKTEDIFAHQPVAEGNFYIYNVGRKMWLCGGSDWGAHAALGNPGVEVTLEGSGDTFRINTHLKNGGNNQYLNNRGYMDTGDDHKFKFIPVAGKTNVYNIVQAADNNRLVAYYPYAGVDGGQGNETTVGTEVLTSETGISPNDEDAQWILVTREERLAMASAASPEHPVDLTFLINRSGFNQREVFNPLWWKDSFKIWEEGENHDDFGYESHNSAPGAYFSYQLEDLPAGVYKVCIQGFYRDGNHGVTNETHQNARFFAGNGEKATKLLPNITDYANLAPGQGVDVGGGLWYPQFVNEACEYFRSGLYNVSITTTARDGYTLPIGVEKIDQKENDWIVVDNIRLYYYGPNATEEAVDALPDPNAYKGE